MDLTEKTIESKEIFDGKVINVKKDKVLLPNNTIGYREVVSHRGGVAIVICDKNDEIYFVKQYRYALKKAILEIPAGKLEKGENPDMAIIREAEEEVGVKVEELKSLGMIYPTCGYSNEIIYLYYTNNYSLSTSHLDIDEFMDVEKIKLDTVLKMIENNEINDGKTVVAILKYSQIRSFKKR